MIGLKQVVMLQNPACTVSGQMSKQKADECEKQPSTVTVCTDCACEPGFRFTLLCRMKKCYAMF